MNIFGKSGGPSNPQSRGGLGGGAGAGGGNASGGPAAANARAGSVPYVTEREFEAEVMRSELPVLLEFTTERSASSKQAASVVEDFARETAGKVKVVKIDVDKSPLLTRELRVQSVPTFMVFAEGRIADGVAGVIDLKKMRALVEPFLPRAAGAVKTAELAELLKAGAVVPIDTREEAAFTRAHLPQAVHMALEDVPNRVAELYMLPGQPVVYCRAGDKTKELTATLAAQGVEVAFLEGGLLAWESDGLPIERGSR